MSDGSPIEWLARPGTKPASWNPVRGCSRVSEGCRHCYAERSALRGSAPPGLVDVPGGQKVRQGGAYHEFVRRTKDGPRWTGKVELQPQKLGEPAGWREPRTVFANSMSDLFHESLPVDQLLAVLLAMQMAPQHVFIVLTKRSRRMREFLTSPVPMDLLLRALAHFPPDLMRRPMPRKRSWLDGGLWHFENVWFGVSVEDQPTARERIDDLVQMPATVHVVSYEPALGPIDLRPWLGPGAREDGWDKARGLHCGIEWLLVGGESGPGARPCRPDWIRSAVARCRAASVPVFVKQRGQWREPLEGETFDTLRGEAGRPVAFLVDQAGAVHCTHQAAGPGAVVLVRTGDKGSDLEDLPDDLRIREFPR